MVTTGAASVCPGTLRKRRTSFRYSVRSPIRLRSNGVPKVEPVGRGRPPRRGSVVVAPLDPDPALRILAGLGLDRDVRRNLDLDPRLAAVRRRSPSGPRRRRPGSDICRRGPSRPPSLIRCSLRCAAAVTSRVSTCSIERTLPMTSRPPPPRSRFNANASWAAWVGEIELASRSNSRRERTSSWGSAGSLVEGHLGLERPALDPDDRRHVAFLRGRLDVDRRVGRGRAAEADDALAQISAGRGSRRSRA